MNQKTKLITKENYECPKGEERLFHICVLDETKIKKGLLTRDNEGNLTPEASRERYKYQQIYKYNKNQYMHNETFIMGMRNDEIQVTIVHNPFEWEQQYAEQLAVINEEKRKQAEEAQQKAFADAVAKEVEKQLKTKKTTKKEAE